MMANSKRGSIEQKPAENFIEMPVVDPTDKRGALGDLETDYSGATRETDPAEIRLVRKLDYRIMPTLWGLCIFLTT